MPALGRWLNDPLGELRDPLPGRGDGEALLGRWLNRTEPGRGMTCLDFIALAMRVRVGAWADMCVSRPRQQGGPRDATSRQDAR